MEDIIHIKNISSHNLDIALNLGVASRIASSDLLWKVIGQVLFNNTYIWNRQSFAGYDNDAFVFNLNEFGNSS